MPNSRIAKLSVVSGSSITCILNKNETVVHRVFSTARDPKLPRKWLLRVITDLY